MKRQDYLDMLNDEYAYELYVLQKISSLGRELLGHEHSWRMVELGKRSDVRLSLILNHYGSKA
jgi:hypothetical protein